MDEGWPSLQPKARYLLLVWEGDGVADINGDGNLDLVAPLYSGSSVALLLGNGDGTVGTFAIVPARRRITTSINRIRGV